MVGIGLNEFVVVSSDTKVNEKDTLELVLKQGTMTEDKKVMLSLSGKDLDEKATKLLLFSPKLTNDSTGISKAAGQIMKEIQDYRKQLVEILLCYMTTAEVEDHFGSTILKSLTGIEDDKAFVNALKLDATINKITLGLNKLFIKLCTDFKIFNSKEQLRVKLWRQKKEKNFPKLPVGFSKWIERMDVPVAKVKIEDFDMKPYDALTTICRVSKEPLEADRVPQEEIDTTQSTFMNPTEETKGFLFPDDLDNQDIKLD
jgi:hypothetical protein